jgi:hypothetical protein
MVATSTSQRIISPDWIVWLAQDIPDPDERVATP